MKSKLTFEPTALAQAAGLGALEDSDFLDQTIDNNLQGINYLYENFDALGVRYVSTFANFIMTVWRSSEEVMRIFEGLMKEGVLVRPLLPPIDHCIRISVGLPKENKHLVEVLSRSIKKP